MHSSILKIARFWELQSLQIEVNRNDTAFAKVEVGPDKIIPVMEKYFIWVSNRHAKELMERVP